MALVPTNVRGDREREVAPKVANIWLRLAEQGRVEELSARRDRAAFVTELAGALGDQGRVDSALALLRPRADGGDLWAAQRLCDLLADHRLREELMAEIAAGTPGAVEALRALQDAGER